MSELITFEQPLNEKSRTLLRLSHLFEQLDFFTSKSGEWNVRGSLQALLDIIAVMTRGDLKTELVKELDRFRIFFERLKASADVDMNRLQHVLQNIEYARQSLKNISGALGQNLRQDEFLSAVLQRSSIPGGTFDFDIPQLHYWLNQSHSDQLLQMDDWRNEIGPVQDAVELLLGMIRESTVSKQCVAERGFYNQTLSGDSSSQLVQIKVAKDENVFCEISGGKQRFTLRFIEVSDLGHGKPTERDIPFELKVCQL